MLLCHLSINENRSRIKNLFDHSGKVCSSILSKFICFYTAGYQILIIIILTLCLSICKGLKFGSNNNCCGSKLTGDCLLPLLHNDHSGFMRPQNAGPEKQANNMFS